jgi:hypothetical protein
MIEEAYLRRRRHIGRFSRNSGGTLGMRAAEQPPMSQVGQLRRIDNGAGGRGMSASPLKADMCELALICPLCANRVLTRRSKKNGYSITSSARGSKVGGISRPSVLAVLRLMMRSNLVGRDRQIGRFCASENAVGIPRVG